MFYNLNRAEAECQWQVPGQITDLSHGKDGEVIDNFNHPHDPAGNIIAALKEFDLAMGEESCFIDKTYGSYDRMIK